MRSIPNFISDYEVCSMQEALQWKQNVQCFIYVIGVSSSDYLLTNCTTLMSYKKLSRLMLPEFYSHARHLHSNLEPEILTLEILMRKEYVTSLIV